MLIPKTIHYCWFGKKKLPKSIKKNIISWKKYCPDFQIKEWNETNFDIESNSFVVQAYNKKAWAFVSDFARLDIIYKYGGIYLDTDVEIIRNIDDLLINNAFVGLQRDGLLCNTGLGFGAESGNEVIKRMRDSYLNLHFSDPKSLACPYLNDPVIRSLGYTNSETPIKLQSITVYPPEFFDPLAPGFVDDLISKSTYTIHHYDASWQSYNEKIKRKIIKKIGQRKVNQVKKILFNFGNKENL